MASLQAVSLSMRYPGSEEWVLKNIHCSFSTPQIICLLGKNGSGKSTFLKLCAGVIPPTYGSIEMNGSNLSTYSLAERANVIGWLPQHLSKPENLNVVDFMRIFSDQSPREALETFGVFNLRHTAVTSLSEGQWKRLQLARLWSQRYSFLFLDEPESSLDSFYQKKLPILWTKYAAEKNSVIVISTHNLAFAEAVADTIYALKEGYLVYNLPSQTFFSR